MISQTYRGVQISKSQKLELVNRTLSEPSVKKVGIRIEPCNVCHDYSLTLWGFFPLITLASVALWEFGLRAIWVFTWSLSHGRRKSAALERLNDWLSKN